MPDRRVPTRLGGRGFGRASTANVATVSVCLVWAVAPPAGSVVSVEADAAPEVPFEIAAGCDRSADDAYPAS
jgi:hypothetical protein